MNEHIERIRIATTSLQQQIVNHKVYSVIQDVQDLRVFMEYHIFAVWDFMSLLKALQNNLTCTSVPWFPKGSADTRHLINEIVVGEESDVDHLGNRKSHFELYLEAMEQCGANLSQIHSFIDILQSTGDFELAFKSSGAPLEAINFVNFTFETIQSGKAHLQAATFTFGREDLIPAMFHSIINDMDKSFPETISIFKYYLERHIEVDGDHHSQLALQMTSELCGSNELYWKEAEMATIDSLQKRIELWDGVYEKIMLSKKQDALQVMQ